MRFSTVAFACLISMLTASSSFAQSSLKGTVILEGAQIALAVTLGDLDSESSIQLGQERFELTGRGTTIEGVRQVREGRGKVIDRNIQIMRDAELVREIARMSGAELAEMLSNASEVRCNSKSNAFVLVSDNITGKVVGNCTTLR